MTELGRLRQRLAKVFGQPSIQHEHDADDNKSITEAHLNSVLNCILDIATDAIIMVDAKQCIVRFNKGGEQIFGYASEEVMGQPLEILLPARFVKQHHKHVHTFATSDNVSRLMDQRDEIVGLRKDGREFPAEASISKFDEGEQTIFAVILRDISQRRQTEDTLRKSEERFRRVFNYTNDAIVVINPKTGEITDVNLKACQVFGYSRDELLSLRMADIHPQNSTQLLDFADSVVEQGVGWTEELICLTKKGQTFSSEVSASVIDVSNKRLMVAVMRDISMRKVVEQKKDAFVSNVSHELRTPIASLKLYHNLLKRGLHGEAPPEKINSRLEGFKHEVDRLDHIIEDLLRLSRLDQEHITLHLTSVDLNEIVRQYYTDRAPLADNQRQTLTLFEEPGLPPIHADKGLIGQVLSILLSNALTYTPQGGHVAISVVSHEVESKLWVGFSVSDTGPGIPPEEQAQLFGRFYRGTVGHDSESPGSGLGLSIAKEIVDRHGGRIDVTSEGVPGKGTTFTVWLPLEQELQK